MRIPLDEIDATALERPRGYREDLLRRGRIEGTDLIIAESEFHDFYEHWRLPTATEVLANFGGAIGRLMKLGFQPTNREEFETRFAICKPCEFWSGNRCAKCGCWRLKLILKTERCPEGKWERLAG